MITIQSSVSKGWLYKNGGFKFTEQYYLDPIFRRKQEDSINALVSKEFPDINMRYMEDDLMQPPYMNDNQVFVGGLQPNMLLAAGLGAKFRFPPNLDPDVEGQPLEGLKNKNDLPDFNTLISHPFLTKIIDQIDHVKTNYPDYEIIPPFFWDASGRATIHGIYTTSYKLIGEEALTMPFLNPDLLHDIHAWITDTYIDLARYFAQYAQFKIKSVHVGECSGTMLEPDLYEAFIIPYISKISTELSPVRLHSCGYSDHLLEKMKGIENLYAISTGSETSVKSIRMLFGKDIQVNYLLPLQLFQANTGEEEIVEWIDRLIEENDNGNLSISFHAEPEYDIKKCRFIHSLIEQRK